ncbi:acyl carrier protein [Oscillatoria salina]|uniref:acyl carrier protein n=1 Tax=Oscillatoria salina TaxID=331517 RepID=UPI0013BD59CC|nr:phosphopantetheine-binding protein [Oscillatoria salina]MBZ8179852.1 acyl carrier protein [Oscillatoria salina IIICB1]NET87124.1 acyl carrier protein [Kamptonema sp. SIO1D9]
MNEIKTKIKNFLSPYFGTREIKDDEDIFAAGFVNSMFAMQLVLFIEQEFQISIENEDLEFDNFRTIEAMTRLVEAKTTVLAN